MVWKQLQPRLQGLAESCALSGAYLRVCSPLSAGHLPQTLQKQSCQNHQGLKSVKITKDPGNCLFTLLPSGKRFRSLMAKTERLRRSFFPQAIRLQNSTQPLNIIMTSLTNHSQSVRYSHSLLSTSYWQCHLHTTLSVSWYLDILSYFLYIFFCDCCFMSTMFNLFAHSSLVQSCLS